MKVNKKVLNKIKRFNYGQLFLGGLQMMNYNLPDMVVGQVTKLVDEEKKKKNLSDINSKIDSITVKYGGSNQTSVPDKISLEKMEFSKPSQSEIVRQSEDSLRDYRSAGLQNIEDEFKLKEDNLNSNKDDILESNNQAKQKLDNYYADAITSIENQALKRGLSRSSIVINQIDAFEKDKINEYKNLDAQLSNQINAINFELSALNSQKQTALNNFDVTYAVKLQEKINSLNQELSEREAEVIKYNNEIALKEANFNKEVDELKNKLGSASWEDAIDMVKLYGEYGPNVVNRVKSDEIYNSVKDYFKNLTREEILYIMSDADFKKKLGDNYTKLVNEYTK